MAANNTIDESIALITSANQVVQNPESVGNALKTISMRIRGAKTELEDAGLETEGMVESTAKLRSEIMALTGVDIMDGANQFKSTYAIMDELAAKWQDLTDIQQATVTELIAGKRQGNIVSSLMTNFDTARDALETSLNSSGSAMAEHEKWQQSLEARINSLKASWQSLSQSFLQSDFLKVAFDAVIKLVDGITLLIDKVGVLPALFTGFAIFKSFSGKGFFKVIEDESAASGKRIANVFTEAFNAIKNTKNVAAFSFNDAFSKSLANDEECLLRYKLALDSGMSKQEAFNSAMQLASPIAQDFAKVMDVTSDSIQKFSDKQKMSELSLQAQDKSFKNCNLLIKAYSDSMKTCGLSQQQFLESIRHSNPQLHQYLSGLNGAKASLKGYIASLIGAKVASLALQAATMALNAALTMGVSALISWAVQGIDKAITASKELAEKVEELTTKFKEQSNELQKLKGNYDASNESSMISKYAKLSKGVDALGRNVSLTTDEYSEYQQIVNQIAEQIPSLVVGYDTQGNALLSVKGDVEELIKAYENLIKVQNDTILKKDNVEDIKDNFKDVVKEESKAKNSREMTNDGINALEEILSSSDLDKAIEEYAKVGSTHGVQIAEAFRNEGIKQGRRESGEDYIKRVITENRDVVQRIVDNWNADLEIETKGMKSIAQAVLSNAFDIHDSKYYDISDTMQNVVRHFVNSFDYDFFKNLLENKEYEGDVEKYIYNMLDQFNSISEDGNATLEAAFNLKTQFNNGDVTYGEYAKGIQEAKDIIDGLDLDDEVKNTIKLSFDDGEITTEINHLRGYLQEKMRILVDPSKGGENYWILEEAAKDIDSFLNSLTGEELAAVIDLKAEINWEHTNREDIRKQIEDRIKLKEALAFETSIEVDTTALEVLNTALEESASAMGLSEESIDSLKAKYADLEGYNPHTLFEKTANGVKVNRDEVVKLEKKYKDLKKTKVQKHLDTLIEEYNKCTKAIDGNISSTKKLELINKREQYAKQIEELAEYQAQLEGVTGAYQRWLDAQNTPEDYEGYQNIATSREDIEDEISRGFISNASKEYIDLLSGKDLQGGTIDDYYEAWKKLDEKVGSTSYSINDFFTVNDDGDITSTGISRFFESVQKEFGDKVYKFNEETGEYYYDFSQKNLEDIQSEWGIGIEAIGLLLEAATSAGYNVDWGGIFDDLDLDTSNFENVEAMISLAEKAQEEFNNLKDVEDVEFNFRTNTIEEATTEVEKARKAYLDLITNKDGSINLKAEGAEQMQFILATLLTQKQQLSTPAIMKVDTSQIDKAEADIIDVINKAKALQTAYENYEIAITTGVDVESAKADLNSAIEGMKGTSVDVRADLKLPTDEELTNAANGIGSIKVGASLDGTSIGAITTKIQTECTPEVIAKVTGLDETAIQNGSQQVVYTAEHSDVDNFINGLTDISKKIIYTYATEGTKPNPSNIERSITYKYKTEGDVPEVNGTANANGTANSGRAFARGNWGIKGSGTALVGELGRELIVRDGKFFTIGDKGAEFFHYKPNDIVFNAAQTESLFKYGGIKGAKPRGTMLATGTAFAKGTALWQATASKSKFAQELVQQVTADGEKGSSRLTTTAEKAAKDAKKAADDAAAAKKAAAAAKKAAAAAAAAAAEEDEEDGSNSGANVIPSNFATQTPSTKEDTKEFKETIDFVEIAISRLERAIDQLDTKVNSVYRSWSERNTALTSEISNIVAEIGLQNSAYDKYMAKANSVGLDEHYASQIRNGSLNIEDFEGKGEARSKELEALTDKISEYQKWYELALDCKDAILELKETESKLYEQRFQNVQSQYDGILQGYEHTESMLNEYISQAEAQGYIVSKNYYNALIDNEESRISRLKQEQSALIAARDEAVAKGKIAEESEAWVEMCNEIDSVTQAIEEGTTALLEYDNAIRQIAWDTFDLIQERISNITDEANFLIELLSNKDLFDDDGNWTEQGIATVGLHGQNYNTYMYQAEDYGNQVAEINKQIAKDPYDQELINRRNELLELQRESILNAEEEKNAIRDLVEEGINLELDALQERIDKYEEALDSEKSLYDYQRKVEESTKNIANIRKQLNAYSLNDDEETRAKVQKLKLELEDAEKDLQQTEYDKFISDQSALLDSLYDEYELVLNQRLDNTDSLIQQIIDGINIAAGADGTITTALGSEGAIAAALGNNANTIKSTLESEAKNVGVTLSDAMNNIWSVGDGNAKSVLTKYGEDFRTKFTTIITTLNGIKTNIGRMVDDVDKDAQKKTTANKTTTSAQKNPTTNSSNNSKPASTSTSGDGVPKVGDKVKFVSGKYYYDSQGKTPLGSKYQGKQVYITKINDKSWATHPIHISTGKTLGDGDLGWLQKRQINGYATGKKNLSKNEIAWTQENGREFIIRPSDGAILTPVAKRDSILNAEASSNIWDMANSPAEFIKENLKFGINDVPNGTNVNNSYTQHIDNVVFRMDNIKNYEEMLYALKDDRRFEKLIEAMTINQIAGKSSLTKGKSIR